MSYLLNIKDDIFGNMAKYFVYFQRDIDLSFFKLISSFTIIGVEIFLALSGAFDFPL